MLNFAFALTPVRLRVRSHACPTSRTPSPPHAYSISRAPLRLHALPRPHAPAGAPIFAIGDILEPYATIKPTRLQRSHLMNDFGSIRDAVSRVAPRYAIAKVAVFSLYASDQARTGGDACLLLDVGCTFSRADAAQFRRFIAEDLGCTVDVVFRSALTAEDFARAETEARVVYENPDVVIASTPDTRAQAAPPAAPKPPVR